jgi:acetate kinase
MSGRIERSGRENTRASIAAAAGEAPSTWKVDAQDLATASEVVIGWLDEHLGTRSGDLDPCLGAFLAKAAGVEPERFYKMVNHESGLLGLFGTSSGLRDLRARQDQGPLAAEAVALFAYQVKKAIGALAAVLGGLDVLVFSGGIGENSAETRSSICAGLEFLGVTLDERRNATHAPLISSDQARTAVRVIRTDEELVIARATAKLL